MGHLPWDHKKIPPTEIDKIQEHLDNRDLGGLFDIHLKYKVSDNNYCCPDPCMLVHFTEIIRKHAGE